MISVALALALAQDVTWVETRFHRVHLRNGNFIDGRLVRESPRFVTLEVRPAGEFGVRRDMIQRVEYIKMRSIKEEPPIVAVPKAEKPTPPAVKPGTAAPARVERASSVPARFAAELRKSVDEALAAYAASNPENRRALAPRLRGLGPEAVAYACWLALHGKPIVDRPELVEAIGDCETADVLPTLLDLAAFASDSFTRAAAVKGLARQNKPEADAAVKAALGDRSGQVWRVAAEEVLALYQKNRASVSELVVAMRSAEEKEIYASVLSKIGGETALKAVQDLLREGGEKDKTVALRALATHARPEDGAAAMELLETAQGDFRRQICVFLGRAKVKPAVRTLLNIMNSEENDTVADSAHWALRQITGLTYPREPQLWEEWWRKAGRAEFPSPVED